MYPYYSQELYHFGIKGQKWGIRRYQNEDGSLTAEGKQRYYEHNPNGTFTEAGRKQLRKELNSQDRFYYDTLAPHYRKYLEKQITNGKSFKTASKEMKTRAAVKAAGLFAASLAINPYTRAFYKSAIKAGVRGIKNSNAVRKGALYLSKLKNRRSLVKNGAVVLKKSAYSVKDYIPKFGGYLN